jgi:hypothetical protein
MSNLSLGLLSFLLAVALLIAAIYVAAIYSPSFRGYVDTGEDGSSGAQIFPELLCGG